VKKLLALMLMLGCGSAQALPVTWTFENTFFDWGGQLTGSFDFDADTGAFSNINVITTSSGSFTLPGAEYNKCAWSYQCGDAETLLFAVRENDDETPSSGLHILLTQALTNAGGTVALRTGGFCEWNPNCGPSYEFFYNASVPRSDIRNMISGQVSAVPIPAAVWLDCSAG
jgi:hypothetical protein